MDWGQYYLVKKTLLGRESSTRRSGHSLSLMPPSVKTRNPAWVFYCLKLQHWSSCNSTAMLSGVTNWKSLSISCFSKHACRYKSQSKAFLRSLPEQASQESYFSSSDVEKRCGSKGTTFIAVTSPTLRALAPGNHTQIEAGKCTKGGGKQGNNRGK